VRTWRVWAATLVLLCLVPPPKAARGQAADRTEGEQDTSGSPDEPDPAEDSETAEPPVQRQWLIPAPPPPPKEPGWFHLDHLGGYLELEGYYEQQRRRRLTSQNWHGLFDPEHRQRNVDWGFRERLGVELSGDIVHPYVFAFDGRLSFGLEQSHFRETINGWSQTDEDTGVLLDFDLRARFLQGGALNGEIYARRADNRVPRRFLPSLDEERMLYGAAFSLRSEIIPMRLTLERETVDRDGGLDEYDQEETRETRLEYEADVLFSDFHTLNIRYEFNDLAEDIAGGDFHFRTRRHEWTLEDRLEFGPGHRHRLDTTLRIQAEKGPLARDLFEFTPRVQLSHTDHLTSYASYQFLKERYEENGLESHRGEYTLVHQLFDSLTTTGSLFGQYERFDDDVTAYTHGASVRSTYQKKNRLGTFRAEAGYAWDQRRERGGEGEFIQTRESATFHDPHPVVLGEAFVVLSTVLVTNPQRTQVYLPFRDYFVTRLRGSVAVHRVPTGQIADGDSVWISYKYRRPTRTRIDTQQFDARVEQQFTFGLRPYYEFNFRHQEIADPLAQSLFDWELLEDNLTRHRVGADYTRDRWSVGVEYESEDNRYDPFDAIHLNGQVTVLQTDRANAALSATYSRFYFDSPLTGGTSVKGSPDNRDVDLLDVSFDGQFDFHDRLSAQLALAYRWENDSVDGVTHGVDVEASLVYLLGQTQIELTGEYDLLELPGSDDDGLGVWLRVRRNLGNWTR